MKKVIAILATALSLVAFVSCGGSKGHEFSDAEKLLMNKTWAPDVNANLQSGNEALEDATGIKSDFQLGGDVKKIGDFFAGKYLFSTGEKDPSQLVYSITTGQGFLSSVTGAGKWEMSEDGKTLFLTPWDYDESKYAEEAEEYDILELTENKLVWQKKGSEVTSTFTCD